MTGRYTEHDHEHYERPRRRTRPRTKDRPSYDDAVEARVVTVDRGWVPNAERADILPQVPPAPLGHVRVTGWLRPGEATVNDALPLLETAEKVSVLAVNPKPGFDGLGDEPGADIALHLARHGVMVTADHFSARGMDAGDMILNYATDVSADLLVMGAYGRSRLRELVLGGVTRHIMQHMTIPVLFSH